MIDGETVETVADFIFGGSKITADGNCSNELPGKKVKIVGLKQKETFIGTET